jgi:hypothetical protein
MKPDRNEAIEGLITRTPPRQVLWWSLPALLLSAGCLGPYLNKGFTIDDPFFLLQAQYIRVSPLHPTMVDLCWGYDNMCGPVAGDAANNLLMSYFLVPVVASGSHEWLAHLMQLVVLWAGIVATVSLAIRLGFDTLYACGAGLILAGTPPVLAMASTAMPDILAMSLGVIGIERLLSWKQEGSSINAVFSALALGLAAFTRMHMVLLWPCAALLLRDDTRFLDVKGWLALRYRWWPVLLAVLVFGIAHELTREHGTTIWPGQQWIALSKIRPNFRAYLIHWVLAMPVGLAWLVLRNKRVRPWLLITLCSLAVWKTWNQPALRLWTEISAGIGAVVLVDIFLWAFQTGKQRRIVCALWLLLPLAALEYFHLPVKYLVACAPAAALLVMEILPTSRRWRTVTVAGITASGVVFGSMVLYADNEFAEMGRQAAVRLIAPRVAAGQRVWLASQWGFQWYALKAGARLLRPNDTPAPGDYLARGGMEGYPETMKRLPPARLVETYAVGGPGGRTMSRKDDAGLYSNVTGDLMWAWGTGEWNHYQLWQFEHAAKSPIESAHTRNTPATAKGNK